MLCLGNGCGIPYNVWGIYAWSRFIVLFMLYQHKVKPIQYQVAIIQSAAKLQAFLRI